MCIYSCIQAGVCGHSCIQEVAGGSKRISSELNVQIKCGSEAGSYLRRIDFVYQSTFESTKDKKMKCEPSLARCRRRLEGVLLQGPRGVRFLMSEAPLYCRHTAGSQEVALRCERRAPVQGYLTYEKTHLPRTLP